MKDEAIVKINKFGKVGAIVANIIRICLLVGIIGLSIGIATILCLPKNMVTFETSGKANVKVDVNNFFGIKITDEKAREIEKEIMNNEGEMELNGVEYYPDSAKVSGNVIEINSSSKKVTVTLRNLVLPMILGLFSMVVIYVTMIYVRRTMLALRDSETPFAENVIDNLRKLGYSFIAWAVMPGITQASFEGVFSGNYNFSVGINVENLLVVLIVNALVVIFRYGAKLQQEADETL